MIKQLAELPGTGRESPHTFWINETRETETDLKISEHKWTLINYKKPKKKVKNRVDSQVHELERQISADGIWYIRYIRYIAWHTLHGSHSLHFPNTQSSERERKTSIKADSMHNLKRRSSSEEMLWLCGLFVLGKWTMPMPRWIGWLRYGLGMAWHTETHIKSQANSARKQKKKKLTVAY